MAENILQDSQLLHNIDGAKSPNRAKTKIFSAGKKNTRRSQK